MVIFRTFKLYCIIQNLDHPNGYFPSPYIRRVQYQLHVYLDLKSLRTQYYYIRFGRIIRETRQKHTLTSAGQLIFRAGNKINTSSINKQHNSYISHGQLASQSQASSWLASWYMCILLFIIYLLYYLFVDLLLLFILYCINNNIIQHMHFQLHI